MQALIRRLRQNGGPPVMYLASQESNADFFQNSSDLQQLFNQQFLHMLRTVLMGNRSDYNTVASTIDIRELRTLRAWWLASLVILAILAIIIVGDNNADFLDTIAFFAALVACLFCAISCLRAQIRAIVELHDYGINAESWYPTIALGLAFLLPGILVETGGFLLSMQKQLRHKAAVCWMLLTAHTDLSSPMRTRLAARTRT